MTRPSFLNPEAEITASSYPYNHIVINNVFHDYMAAALTATFNELVVRGKSIGKVGEVGDLVYDAINYTPTFLEATSTAMMQIASVELQAFIAQLFQIRVDENVIIGLHRHEAPSKPGWAHTDFAIVSFPSTPPNYRGLRIYCNGMPFNYSDDSRDRQPGTLKTARALACLYYIANPPWLPGGGGETGIYADLGKRLTGSVPPVNNSLFIFEITPLSYHGYLGSPHAQRNSFIWWYHADPGYLLKRHQLEADAKRSLNMDPWDRWTDVSVPKYEVEVHS